VDLIGTVVCLIESNWDSSLSQWILLGQWYVSLNLIGTVVCLIEPIGTVVRLIEPNWDSSMSH